MAAKKTFNKNLAESLKGKVINPPAGYKARPTTDFAREGLFTILDNDAYNDNVLSVVDASLENCVKFGTLKEIYSTLPQPEFFNSCSNRFVGELFKLKQRLFQLKKKSVVSNLS